LTAFAISSFIIGVAGALWAFVHLGSWEPLAFNIDRSFQVLFMVIIGGLGSIMGSFLGAAFILTCRIMLDQLATCIGLQHFGRNPCRTGFDHYGGADLLSADRRAAWLCPVRALAKEKMRLWPYPY